jgi:hypothetical protein
MEQNETRRTQPRAAGPVEVKSSTVPSPSSAGRQGSADTDGVTAAELYSAWRNLESDGTRRLAFSFVVLHGCAAVMPDEWSPRAWAELEGWRKILHRAHPDQIDEFLAATGSKSRCSR